jgi:hypothetical protein
MGVVPGDAAYAFYMALRRMLQEQHVLLDQMRARTVLDDAAVEGMTRDIGNRMLDQTQYFLNTANWRTAALGAIALFLVGAAGFGAGYIFHGSLPLIAGLVAGPMDCHRPDGGGKFCTMGFWQELPPPAAKGDK